MPAETTRAWPWRRRGRFAAWAVAAAILATSAVLLLSQAVPPLLVWSHLGGTPISVRGVAPNHRDPNGTCMGWVNLPPKTPVPSSELNYWQVLTRPGSGGLDVQHVTIRSAHRCVDGQYWAHRPGDHTLWARTPNNAELWQQFFVLFGGYMLLGVALKAGRGCINVIRPGSAVTAKLTETSAWYHVPKGAGKRAAEKVAPDAQRAQPWITLPGPLSLAIFTGTTAAALAALAIAFVLTDLSIVPAWTGVLAVIAPFVVANAAIAGNRRLSSRHRAKLRRHGLAMPGEIVDCSTFITIQPRSSTRVFWVVLTVTFDDPERSRPLWISRTYLFTQEPDPAAEFATRYRKGTDVTVYRSAGKLWYALDFEDSHLAWSQWW